MIDVTDVGGWILYMELLIRRYPAKFYSVAWQIEEMLFTHELKFSIYNDDLNLIFHFFVLVLFSNVFKEVEVIYIIWSRLYITRSQFFSGPLFGENPTSMA